MVMKTITARYLRSSEAARRIGVTRKTLSKWRHEKKGPGGWIYLSPTMAVYPESEVEAFMKMRAATTPTFKFGRPVTIK